MDFRDAIAERGFAAAQDRTGRGVQTYTAHPNRFLTYWLHLYDDGSALLTWEFAVTDYLAEVELRYMLAADPIAAPLSVVERR